MSTLDQIEKAVLALPLEQRVMLAESLLESLPKLPEETSTAEDIAEAERRDREIEVGQVQPLSNGEFWQRVDENRRR